MTGLGKLHTIEEGAGPTVVLVHGFTQTSRSWQPIVDGLVTDHRVIRVDAPGHGRSSDVQADLWDGGRLVGQAGGEAAYVGYSMGGRLCLHLALCEPSKVRALVLVGTTAGLESRTERAERREADEALARRLEVDGLEPFLMHWLAQPLFAGLSPEAADIDDRMQNTVNGLASSLRLAGTGTQDPPLWERLDELTMPVLVVVGERDTEVPSAGRTSCSADRDAAPGWSSSPAPDMRPISKRPGLSSPCCERSWRTRSTERPDQPEMLSPIVNRAPNTS